MYYGIMKTKYCDIILVGDEKGLRYLYLDTGVGKRGFRIEDDWVLDTDFFSHTINEIDGYFNGRVKKFSVKLNLIGTPFQKRVWIALMDIPYGETRSYKEIANVIGNEKAPRAVGMANGKNPIPLIVPCHRVIGTDGKAVGYAHGLTIKKQILDLEKVRI